MKTITTKTFKAASSNSVGKFILCILSLAVLSSPMAMGASRVWSGLGGNTSWSAAANWDTLPVANDDLTFNGTTRLTNNNNITANTTFTGITYTASAGAFVLGGNQITLGGQVTNSSFNLQTINLNMILSGQQTFSSTVGHGDFLVNGILSGTGGFIKGGSGTTLTLGSANTHTGESWLQNGSLQLNNVNALQNSALRFESTGSMIFAANGGNATTYNIGQLKGSSAVVGIAMGANTLSVGGNNGTYTYAGMLSGTGSFIKVGTGTLALTNTGTSYSGNLSVKQGTLSINSINNASANGTLGNSANSVSLGNTGGVTGTLAYTAGNATSNKKFTMATGGTGAFDVSTTATELGLTGVINGSGNMTKTGTGTLTVNGTNTYTGTTTVSAGTFFVDGNQASATGAVSVQTSSTLGGIGTIGGNTTIAGGATLSPGHNAVGNLTFSKNLSFAATDSLVLMTVGNGTRGTNYDAVTLGATGILGYNGNMTLTINAALADATYDLYSFTGSNYAGTFNSISFLGTGPYSGLFSTADSGATFTANQNGQLLTFTTATGDLTVVPEPASVALLVIGTSFLLWRRKKTNIAKA
jgi:autotransporter-associated beta strand protein